MWSQVAYLLVAYVGVGVDFSWRVFGNKCVCTSKCGSLISFRFQLTVNDDEDDYKDFCRFHSADKLIRRYPAAVNRGALFPSFDLCCVISIIRHLIDELGGRGEFTIGQRSTQTKSQ